MMQTFQWIIVGAGPAGIAALGKLLDLGVTADQIAWIDPAFQVGDLGTKWRTVSSNTKVDLFLQFLSAYKAFQYHQCQENYALHKLDPDQTCLLQYVVDPLLWVTKRLKSQVHTIQSTVLKLKMDHAYWHISLQDQTIKSKNVILAIGAEPKLMDSMVPVIPLVDALDENRLQNGLIPKTALLSLAPLTLQ